MGSAVKSVGRLLTHRVSLRVIGFVVGAVFVYASLDKIAYPDRFADVLNDYQMLPLLAINASALVMPWVEMVTGGALIFGVWRRGAGLIATGLTVVFLVGIAQAEIRGLDIECGCFDLSGNSTTKASWDLFVRDIPLLLGSVLVWRKA